MAVMQTQLGKCTVYFHTVILSCMVTHWNATKTISTPHKLVLHLLLAVHGYMTTPIYCSAVLHSNDLFNKIPYLHTTYQNSLVKVLSFSFYCQRMQ